jgi:hypothetical protein
MFSPLSPSAGAHLFFFTGEDNLGFTGDTPEYTPPGYTAHNGWGCDSNKQGDWVNPVTGAMGSAWFCNPNEPSLPNGGAAGPTPVKAKPDFFTSILDPSGLSWNTYGSPFEFGGDWQWNPVSYQAASLHRDMARQLPGVNILADAHNGNLPNVAFVTPFRRPDGDTSQHNADSMAVGNNWITQVLQAVASGPEATSTAVLLTWDDCGCFYDHVPPPAGLGPRVPLLIWSAWAKHGYVDHQQARFSSILAFIEHNFGLPSLTSLNPNAQDGYQANDLMGDFDFTQSHAAAQATVKGMRLPALQQIPLSEQKWLRAHSHAHDDDDT